MGPHWVGVLTIRRAPQSRAGWLARHVSDMRVGRNERYALSVALSKAAHVATVGRSLPTAGGGCDAMKGMRVSNRVRAP